MNVQELIEKLLLIEDKTKLVKYPYRYFPDDSKDNIVEYELEHVTVIEEGGPPNMSNAPTEFDDAICDGIEAATAKQKKHVYRVGDVVRIVNPRFIARVGYPLVWTMLMPEFEAKAKLDQARDMMSALIVGSIPEDAGFMFDKRKTSEVNATRDFLKGVCMAAIRMRGFGGNERSLHYQPEDDGCWEHYQGATCEVIRRRTVKTGTRFAGHSSVSYEGEHDYESGGLGNMRTHTLLRLDNYLEIEAANVELVKAAEPMYYVRNVSKVVGNSVLWWAEGGHGYTCDLRKAWKVPESKAREICRDRPKEDFIVLAKKAEAATELHVDSQLFPLHNRRRTAKSKRLAALDDLKHKILDEEGSNAR